MTQQLPPIVPFSWLDEHQATLVDVRWYLDGRSGRDAYEAGHLPGAVFVDLDEVLAAPAAPESGRHPLPSPEVFAKGLGQAGIGLGEPVVAYDDFGGMTAGRLVWMLRALGQPAALLDGGLAAYEGDLVVGIVSRPAVDRPPQPWPNDAIATANEVAAQIRAGGIVVDSRSPDRYRGDTEPVDPRAGHIPGARNLPFADNLDESGRFRPPAELADRFRSVNADNTTVFYCGSGVSACHNVLAMEAAGLGRPRLYVGSWSQWSSDPDRPAATGPSS